MKIIGCDFHPSYQQIAMLDQGTGEFTEMRLSHQAQGEEARKFYSALHGPVRVGLEASGQSQWFERLLAELGQELWIGDAAKIRASTDRKQKTDRRDAELLLQLLVEDRFPRIWVPTVGERDARQLLLHRAKLVRGTHADKEPVAGTGVEPGCATEMEVMDGGGTKAAGKFGAAAVGQPEKNGVAETVGRTGCVDHGTG